jgi:hypothetical protein
MSYCVHVLLANSDTSYLDSMDIVNTFLISFDCMTTEIRNLILFQLKLAYSVILQLTFPSYPHKN